MITWDIEAPHFVEFYEKSKLCWTNFFYPESTCLTRILFLKMAGNAGLNKTRNAPIHTKNQRDSKSDKINLKRVKLDLELDLYITLLANVVA